MIAVVDFKDAVVAFKVVAFEDARLFKLGEYAVDGGQADVFIGFEQDFVDVFGGEVDVVFLGFTLHDFQYFHARTRDFEAGFFNLLAHVFSCVMVFCPAL